VNQRVAQSVVLHFDRRPLAPVTFVQPAPCLAHSAPNQTEANRIKQPIIRWRYDASTRLACSFAYRSAGRAGQHRSVQKLPKTPPLLLASGFLFASTACC
jgi:hypothetical protein